jgi:NAD(P)-dependent dehydrogenase (short-subunit alcohol dehydrogenase family)
MSTLSSTQFGFETTAAEVLDGVDLRGKRAIVTGAASGIGMETARALAGAGAAVTLAVRDTAKGAEVAADIARSTGNEPPAVAAIELADPAGIDAFAAAWDGPLHILVNNAGVMALPERTLTAAGHELQFAIDQEWYRRVREQLKDTMPVKSTEQGAATSVLLAASPLTEGLTGRYFEDCQEAQVVHERGRLGADGVAAYALDPDNAERLWARSLELIGRS